MPKKIQATTKDYIINAPLPVQTDTYTVISHDFIISKTKELLAANNLEIERELYSCNINADIARGTLFLNSSVDPDLGMSFNWVNSYDKSTKFSCAISGNIRISDAIMMSNGSGSYIRKHTGTADTDILTSLSDQITNSAKYFAILTADKDYMKNIKVSERKRAEVLGLMYFYNQLLTSDQINVVKKELVKPSFTYAVGNDTLWYMYCCIAHAISSSHPKTWMQQQELLYLVVKKEFSEDFLSLQVPAVLTGIDNVDVDDTVETQDPANVIPEGQLTIPFDTVPDENIGNEEPVSEESTIVDCEEPQMDVPNEELPHGEVLTVEAVIEAPVVETIPEDIASDTPLAELLTPAAEPVVVEETVEGSLEDLEDGWICLTCNKVIPWSEVMYGDQECGECFSKRP
jgi:hypothetical protein